MALSDDFKQSFDVKFDIIVESDVYKNKTDDEKDEIINKLIESEKIQQEIVQEQEEQEMRKEEIKQELGGMSEELNNILTSEEELSQSEQVANVVQAIENIKNELQEIIDSTTSTSEEIAQAQEKLEKVETLENEYVYQETSSAVQESTNSNDVFSNENPGLSIGKIYGIYRSSGHITVYADFIQKNTIAGVEIFSRLNGYCEVKSSMDINEKSTYAEIVNQINNSEIVFMFTTCANKNDKELVAEREQYFHDNKYSIGPTIKNNENSGFVYEVVESWNNIKVSVEDGKIKEEIDIDHPEYIVSLTDGDQMILYLYYFNDHDGKYSWRKLEKICPEFWAWVESEQSAK